MTYTMLVVENDPSIREAIVLLLRDAGYRVFAAKHADDARRILTCVDPNLILTDLETPVLTGSGRYWRRYPDQPPVPVVVFPLLLKACGPKRLLDTIADYTREFVPDRQLATAS